MNILIAGGSGFIGTHLVQSLPRSYTITVLGRDAKTIEDQFDPHVKALSWDALAEEDASQYDIVVNLCGYNIAASRWSDKVKNKIIDSRVKTNKTLTTWLMNQNCKPHFYCANAVGIYGAHKGDGNKTFDEYSSIDFTHPDDFLSEVGVAWQKSLNTAVDFGIPVTITRFGIVLSRNEGMLKKLTPVYYLGLGSVLGDGKQVISWVHIDDVVRAFHFLFDRPQIRGAVNVTSPNPVTQAEFAKALANAMNRPLFLKTPAFVIRLLFGEMGEYLLLRGQRVVPKRLQEEGFEFNHPHIEDAFAREYSPK